MSRIENLHARQILDSRGRPTVEVDVLLDDGISASAAVPSDALTSSEAHELRDGDPRWYAGLGVTRAVANVNSEIARAVRGRDPLDQQLLDKILIELDGTPTLSRLGANAILGVSLATCRAAAEAQARPVFDWIGELAGNPEPGLPMPMSTILSGGTETGLMTWALGNRNRDGWRSTMRTETPSRAGPRGSPSRCAAVAAFTVHTTI